jgi:hypothetical protein
MKKVSQTGLLFILLITSFNNAYSQLSGLGSLVAGGAKDAQTLLQPYISPAVNAFGAALAGGWYNTAETHKLGGFDFSISVSAAIVPKQYQTFQIDTSMLDILDLADPNDNQASTIAGANDYGPLILYNHEGYSHPVILMPKGLNTRWIPAPMIQAGVGLIKGTELIVRYVPNIKIDKHEFGLWGIGGKHDIKQWIPGLKNLPVLQLSIMYGYTRLHTFIDIDVDEEDINAGGLPSDEPYTWDNQYLKMVTQSQTANLLIGAKLPVISLYGAVGFVTTKTNLKLTGDYPSIYIDGGIPTVHAVTNPIDMEMKNQDGSITKPRFNAGFRLKLSVITLHCDYSWANYSVITAGLGVSIK